MNATKQHGMVHLHLTEEDAALFHKFAFCHIAGSSYIGNPATFNFITIDLQDLTKEDSAAYREVIHRMMYAIEVGAHIDTEQL